LVRDRGADYAKEKIQVNFFTAAVNFL
jgi:hypothetical protein